MKPKILIVDDEKMLRDTLAKWFKPTYDCLTAPDAAEAMKIVEANDDLALMISDVKMPDGAVDYRIMTRQMVNSIIRLCEKQRFSKGLFCWVGFDTKWVEYQNVERTVGTTKWSFWSLFKYALDGITSFSVSPLRFIAVLGFVISALAFIWIIITLIQTLIMGIDVPGYVTTLCAVLFMGGIIEMSVGVLGEYIGRIYIESKDRPIYIAKETNLEDKEN